MTSELDHHFLLPPGTPLIRVGAREREVEAVFTPHGRRWLFPRGDCVLLPVSNTTAELLAQYLGQRLLTAIEKRTGVRPTRIEVAVDENHGQWGVWRNP